MSVRLEQAGTGVVHRARQISVPVPKAALALGIISAPVVLGRAGLLTEYQALMVGFGCVYAMAALSINILTGYAGQVSLGHAAFLGIGAYGSGWVTYTHERPFLLGLLVAAGVGAVSALIIGFPALRIRGLNLALLTLGFGLAMASMVFRLRAVTGSAAGLPLPRPNINGYILNDNREYLAVALALLIFVAWLDGNLISTKIGRALRAVRENEDVASSFGVDVARYKLLAFTVSGAVAGLAGAVFGHLIGIAQVESFNFELSLTLVVIVVLGGLGSRWGAIAAGAAFGILPRVLGFLEGWDLVVGPALVALSLARHPGGLAQLVGELNQRLWRRRPDLTGALPLTFARPRADADGRPPAIDPTDSPLSVEDLRVRFGGLRAVDGLSFEAAAGAITGIVGPNGAGKSTVFNAISGFVQPETGRVLLGGADITAAPPHVRAARGLGRTFQLVGLVKALSIRENLLLAQHVHARYSAAEALVGAPRARRAEGDLDDIARLAAESMGLASHIDRPVGQLSHGQQRMVEITCALATRPLVVLLDEPTAGLSPAAAEALGEGLLDLRTRLGQTIVLIEHHMPFVNATCEHVVVMVAGRALAAGSPSRALSDPAVVAAYLGDVA